MITSQRAIIGRLLSVTANCANCPQKIAGFLEESEASTSSQVSILTPSQGTSLPGWTRRTSINSQLSFRAKLAEAEVLNKRKSESSNPMKRIPIVCSQTPVHETHSLRTTPVNVGVINGPAVSHPRTNKRAPDDSKIQTRTKRSHSQHSEGFIRV
eukprot:Filipodium_phascolosomae@DN6938_c0_g1_i1.p1